MIKEAYVSYEVAKLLKEKGFNEPCHKIYIDGEDKIKGTFNTYMEETMTNEDCEDDGDITVPTHQITLAWLREKGISIEVISTSGASANNPLKFDGWYARIITLNPHKLIHSNYGETYEETLEKAIKYSLENLI